MAISILGSGENHGKNHQEHHSIRFIPDTCRHGNGLGRRGAVRLINGERATEELSLDGEPQVPGRIESTGIYFEVKNSEWLNVSVASSELIKLALESLPNMIGQL